MKSIYLQLKWNHIERGKRLSEKVIVDRKHSPLMNRGEVHRLIFYKV